MAEQMMRSFINNGLINFFGLDNDIGLHLQ